MDWDHRKRVILKELVQYNASILCFQEVDRFGDLQYILQKDGFKGVLKARTGDACDGCAIFWKKKRQRQRSLVHEWKDEEMKLARGSEEVTCLQHDLQLQSAYLGVHGDITTRDDIGEPLGTMCHSKSMGTPDYIWHSAWVVPFRVLETLPGNALRKIGGLPNEEWGSDHLALVCEFAFVEDAAL